MYPTEKNKFYGIFVKEQVESLRAAGMDVDVYFIDGKKNRLNYLKSVFALVKLFKCRHYDLIHAHHSYCVFPARIAQKLASTKLPLLLTFHEGEVHLTDAVKLKDVGLIKILVFSKKIKLAALKMTDFVISVHTGLIDKLNFKGKFATVPCGVDFDLFKPLDKKQRYLTVDRRRHPS
jgi:glycosyltransferase involved in cell wall biosynthesis